MADRGRFRVTSTFGFSPDPEDTAVVTLGTTRDGLTQLRRHWVAPEPAASVLVVHGIAEHCGRYEHVARQFVDAGITVVSFDQRGFGDSGGRRAHVDSFDRFHDDVEDHLSEVRSLGSPTFLLGHSLGGLVVGSYALTDRPQADGVMLSSPAFAVDGPQWLASPVTAVGRRFDRVRVRAPLDLADLSSDPRVGVDYDADPLVDTRTTLGLVSEMLDTIKSVNNHIAQWDHETIVIHGLDDHIVPPEASEAIGELDGVTRLTYPNGRHELLNEPFGPEIVAELIAWLQERI